MDELLEQFLVEGRELVQAAAEALLALEGAPGDAALLDAAFRAVHTLKGGAGVLDLAPMGVALHAAEDLLGAVRAGRRAVDAAALDAVLAVVGACEGWLDALAARGALPPGAEEAAAALVSALSGAPHAGAPHAGASTATGGADEASPGDAAWLAPLLRRHASEGDGRAAATALRYEPVEDSFFLGEDPLALLRLVPDLLALDLALAELPAGAAHDPFRCRTTITALSAAPAAAVRAPFRLVADRLRVIAVPPADAASTTPAAPAEAAPPDRAAPATLTVPAARVDALLALAGELVTAAAAAGGTAAELGRLSGALYETALHMRLVPLSQCFRRLPRVVRDAAGKLGRRVDFAIEGDDLELDKAVVDGLHQPLLHLLRNAVDHGIEPAEARRAAGKPQAGRILLRARRGGAGTVVTVSDDGAGMDPARIRAAAARRGLGTEETLAALDDARALDLVFSPGFSTAERVTDISGRGVGMDAVRAGVASLGGTVSIESRPGAGSTVRIDLPRSDTVAALLVVEAGGERFAVPAEGVSEVVRVPPGAVLPAAGGDAFVLRDRVVPLLRLADVLGLSPRAGAGDAALPVLVLTDGSGVAVDALGRRASLLVRPPEGLLAAAPGLIGTALAGDGRPLMVLDLPELARWP